jgi:hypothetical protein
MIIEDLRGIVIALLFIALIVLLLSGLLLIVSFRKMRTIDIPQGAGFAETLLYTPLLVVLAIDLLDLGLDFLSAPVSWVILDRLGLKALRGVATIEALFPGTQLLPTLTLSWIGARLFRATR